MNSRQLIFLSGAAVVIIAGAIWMGASRESHSEPSAALYPALKGQLQKIDHVKIFKAGDKLAVDLTRNSTGWHVQQRHDFPADDGKVDALLINLEGAKIAERKTSNPENYPALNVQDLSAANASGARIEIDGIEPPIKLIVGKQDALTRSTYVRRAGEAPSWSVNSQFDAPADAAAWLKRDVLNIGADRIQEAIVEINGAPRYSVAKAKRADANFDVVGIPKGREVNSVSAPNAIAQSLVNLQLEDVLPAAELVAEKQSAHTSIRTFDGLVLDLEGYAKDDKRWLIVKASFNEEVAKKFYQPVTQPVDADKKVTDKKSEAKPDAQDFAALQSKVNAEAAAINQKLGNWAIAVPSYKYDTLFKPIEQLLKKKS